MVVYHFPETMDAVMGIFGTPKQTTAQVSISLIEVTKFTETHLNIYLLNMFSKRSFLLSTFLSASGLY